MSGVFTRYELVVSHVTLFTVDDFMCDKDDFTSKIEYRQQH